MFKPSSFNINYYLNMTRRGYTHDQVINSIQYDREEQFIKDIEEFFNKKKIIPKVGIVPRKGSLKKRK